MSKIEKFKSARRKNRELIKSKEISGIYSTAKKIIDINLNKIELNLNQPRKNYDEKKLQELKISLKEHGLLQPILVRKIEDGKYQIIAGHRRYLAAKSLNWQTIQAIIKENATDNRVVLDSLIENIHRDNLSVIEVAMTLDKILKSNIYSSIGEMAQKLGFGSKSKISRYLGFLKLPISIQDRIKNGEYANIDVINALITLKNEKLIIDTYNKISTSKMNKKDAIGYINTLKNKNKEVKNIKGSGFLYAVNKNKTKLEIDFSKLDHPKKDEIEKILTQLDAMLRETN